EPAWYEARGYCHAIHVGHPYFDELAGREVDDDFVSGLKARVEPLVAILPGSRTQELRRNLPLMVRAAAKLFREHPGARFAVACLHERHRAIAETIVTENWPDAAMPAGTAAVAVYAGRTPELIRAADVAWAVSGSVSLELMMEALPTVILYKLNRFDL